MILTTIYHGPIIRGIEKVLVRKTMKRRLVNSYLAGGDFCRLLIILANSLDADQNVDGGPDLDPNRLTLW